MRKMLKQTFKLNDLGRFLGIGNTVIVFGSHRCKNLLEK